MFVACQTVLAGHPRLAQGILHESSYLRREPICDFETATWKDPSVYLDYATETKSVSHAFRNG